MIGFALHHVNGTNATFAPLAIEHRVAAGVNEDIKNALVSRYVKGLATFCQHQFERMVADLRCYHGKQLKVDTFRRPATCMRLCQYQIQHHFGATDVQLVSRCASIQQRRDVERCTNLVVSMHMQIVA